MPEIPISGLDLQILCKIDSIRTLLSETKLSNRAIVPEIFLDLLNDFLGHVKDEFIQKIEDIRSMSLEDENEQITKVAQRYMGYLRGFHDHLLKFTETCESISVSNSLVSIIGLMVGINCFCFS